MNLSTEGLLRRAVSVAFVSGIAASFNVGAQEAPTPVAAPEAAPVSTLAVETPVAEAAPAKSEKAIKLEKVEVTGSRIRRVDSESSDLVQTLDRKQIQATGAATLGQLLQSVPSVQGTPYNSAVNNGGGDGAATANLRGLSSKRTLILLDGLRLNSNDLNAIPANMIERIEVLKEGAGAIYGTDAIGGVVNFITRKRFQGIEASSSYGDTQHGGGSTRDYELTMGGKIGDGFAVVGASYNRQDEIYAADRPTSDAPTGYYYGQVSDNAFTSSRSAGGRFTGTGYAPTNAADANCPGALSGVTLIDGRPGTTASDFRQFCQNFGPGYSDRYNYQTENLAITPSKRYSFFGSASYPIIDSVKWNTTAHYTDTRANAQLAAEPFDNVTIAGIYPPPTNPAPTISAANVYNPFGRNITGFGKRSTAVGDRLEYFETNTIQFRTSFKGQLFDKYDWDVGYNYGRDNQNNHNYGFLNFSQIYQQLGPSYIDSTSGQARCGTPSSPIPNCTPINVFGTTGATIASLSAPTNFITTGDEGDAFANLSGEVLQLPAGALGLAGGFQYRSLHFNYQPDALAQSFGLSEANSKATAGAYNVREYYAEATVPVFSDILLAKSLKFNLGVRQSNYSSFGNTTDGKYAFEWKPYTDLMLRGTYSDVFRAPNTTELFRGASQTSPAFSDPCSGLDAATVAAHPNACAGVPANYKAPNTQANGAIVGNPDLKPETGFATDFGFVFSPSFYKPLSITADYWRYTLKDAIDTVSLNTILNNCFANEGSAFCGNAPNGQKYFVRDAGGNVANSQLPYVNSQKYITDGYDVSIKLDYPKIQIRDFDLGRWSVGVDMTYLKDYHKYNYDPGSGVQTSEGSYAGQYDAQDTGDSFPRLRLLGFVFWNKGPFSVSVQDRFLSNLREGSVDLALIGSGTCYDEGGTVTTEFVNGDRAQGACYHNTGSANYVDTSFTYALKKYNTDFTVGVNDLFDDGAQQSYNSALAGASNPIYDIRGRNFYGRIKLTIK